MSREELLKLAREKTEALMMDGKLRESEAIISSVAVDTALDVVHSILAQTYRDCERLGGPGKDAAILACMTNMRVVRTLMQTPAKPS